MTTVLSHLRNLNIRLWELGREIKQTCTEVNPSTESFQSSPEHLGVILNMKNLVKI